MNKKYLNLSPEIQEYIEFALSDGKITTKEVELIKRKAKEFGDDLDELELVLTKILVEVELQVADPEPEFIETTPKYGLVDSFILGWKNCFKFKGRASRTEFWYFFLIWYSLYILSVYIQTGFLTGNFGQNEKNSLIFMFFISLFQLILCIPYYSLISRRMHDISKSFWFGFIPFYNFYLFCKAGVKGENKYGEDPYKVVLLKKIKNENGIVKSIANLKLQNIGGFIWAINAFSQQMLAAQMIEWQLDHTNKWLYLFGGILITMDKSSTFILNKYKSK